MDKEEIRKQLLEKRAALSAEDVACASREIVNTVLDLPEWKEAEEVVLYWPIKNEVDVHPLLEQAWREDKRVLMPCCKQTEPGHMDFGVVTCENDLGCGAFGIMEPSRESCEFPEDIMPDLIIVPGVGFDREGYRIGFGGGYYDRFLARPQKDNFIAVGVCYSFQVVDGFSHEGWDKPMNLICTDEEKIWRN